MKAPKFLLIIYFFSLVWLVFTFLWFLRDSEYRWLYTSVGMFYTVSLAISAIYMSTKKKWAWWLAVILTGLSILVLLLDQIGWIDILYITCASGVLLVLIKNRKLT